MPKRKNKTNWYQLDNAAKIYPPTANERRPHVFSFSAMVVETVEPVVLRDAVQNVTNRNPTFKTKLMKGKFWYYLEENNLPVKVFREEPYYLKSIDYKRNNNFLFQVLYQENRITINFFHALTDGTGGFNFFSQILLEYFKLMNYDIDSEGLISSVDTPFFFEEGDDSFLFYDKKVDNKPQKLAKPYKINGTSFSYDGCGLTTAQIPVEQIKTLAKEKGVTITAYLSGIYLYTIYSLYLRNRPIKNKLITLLVPCNLRKKYGGNTMRNFTMFARVSHNFNDDNITLDQCIKISQDQILEQLTVDKLDAIIHSNVKTEKNPFIKIVPLSLKNLIMRMAYVKVGENLQTCSFSNLGAVKLPKSFSTYVKHITFSIAPTYTCRQQFTGIGFNDHIYLTFSRDYVENSIEKQFFRILTQLGVSVKIFSNYWESQP